jgi:hypothetical protein
MANITKSTGVPCYECSTQCIGSISRNVRISVTANPEFWGFSGVLISGWATYSHSLYDFFDGFDEDHEAESECRTATSSLYTSFVDTKRPDVFYRSVYDPDTGKVTHYDKQGKAAATGTVGRGGPEVYLIDRPKGLIATGTSTAELTTDGDECEDPPFMVFSEMPDNFGWGNKIFFDRGIYKNLTGGWRLSNVENCYNNNIDSDLNTYTPSGYLQQCDGSYKQNILREQQRYQNIEPNAIRGSGKSQHYEYSGMCIPDGMSPKKYGGRFYTTSSISRTDDFIELRLSYGDYGYLGAPNTNAKSLVDGMNIGLHNTISGQFNNVYKIFDVTHVSRYTTVKLIGTSTGNAPLNKSIPTGLFSLNIPSTGGHWVAFDTYDPNSCCGLAAYGVSDDYKRVVPGSNYHTDFRKIFNNPKNNKQSNRDREWREDYGLVSNESGIEFLYVPHKSGQLVDTYYPSVSGVEVSGRILAYPILMDGDTPKIALSGHGTYTSGILTGFPSFDREKSYYGKFTEIDPYNNRLRNDQNISRGISKNATCYTKQATLEMFQEAIVQYDRYEPCGGGDDEYATNTISRLRFIYRGCDFHDECKFDNNGLPLGEWADNNSEPQNINDLRRMLGGQELHMFVNLSPAWGGRVKGNTPCSCDDSIPGYIAPRHVTIHSEATFPNFLNFDLNPVKYGCNDSRHQISQIINRGLLNTPETAGFPSEYCDPLTTCEDIFGFNYACLPRQPYTTYGYIMNLCGKKNANRKDVIKNAFAKMHQYKSLTNINPNAINPETGDPLEEPMYWSVIAPSPLPYTGNGWWGSGQVDSEGDGYATPLQQVAGNSYGFWGLADENNQLVAPYFTTRNGEFISCNTVHTDYVDFSVTGTFRNVLNTHNGWPTSAVPFFIEIENLEGCNGCAVTQMKNTNLTLEIDGALAEYITPEENVTGSKLTNAGNVQCKYGKTTLDVVAGGKAYVGVQPAFTCTGGFDVRTCSGTVEGAAHLWLAHTGDTCECVNGFSCTLYPVPLSGTQDRIIGWTSNPDGGAAGLVEIPGCADDYSSYFNVQYDAKGHGGYKIFAEFELTCPALKPFLTTAEYPDAKYEGDTLTSLYTDGCGHTYPAELGSYSRGGGGALELYTTLYMISVPHEGTFRRLSEFALKRLPGMGLLGNGIIYPPSEPSFTAGQEQNYFGTCPGDYVYTYGCKPEGTYFYGCDDGNGRYQEYPVCASASLCTTCPVGNGEGEISCVCGEQVGYEGTAPSPPPIEYQFNECDCLCTQPHVIAKYQIRDYNNAATGLVLVEDYGGANCAVVNYMSAFGFAPISIRQGPPYPYMGIVLGTQGTVGDLHSWSQGVNAFATGVDHLVYPPYLGRKDLISQTECPQLSIDHGIEGHVPSCDNNYDCELDPYLGTRTCGPKLYANITDAGIKVRRRKCFPEAAIVTKIECEGSNYKLHISREYHEHDRTWSTQEAFEIEGSDPPEYEYRCVPVNAGGYIYNDQITSGCLILPYSVLSDNVTPVGNAPCSINPSSGVHVLQDYQYIVSTTGYGFDPKRTPVDLANPSHTWNYFNLFYTDNFKPAVTSGILVESLGLDESGFYQCDRNAFPPEYIIQNASGKTIFTQYEYNNPPNFNGIFATDRKHSCIQDAKRCGGDLWCNKLFFPRRSYNAGTKVARFGVPQICTGTNEPDAFQYLAGYKESRGDNSVITIDSAVDLLKEASRVFVDWCQDENLATIQSPVGIDDSYIIVDDYLPLIGVTHPGWKHTSDTQSCTVLDSGGCVQNISVHNNASINFGVHAPKTWQRNRSDSMGYYLDKHGVTYDYSSSGLIAASGNDKCLVQPFKIHIDTECNTNRIQRRDFPNDDPTLLQGVQMWDSRACLGIYGGENCSCAGTMCKYASTPFEGNCVRFLLTDYKASIGEDDDGPCLCGAEPSGEWWYEEIIGGATALDFTPRDCSGCTEPAGPGNWIIRPCAGEGTTSVVRTSNTSTYVKTWQCDEKQYMYRHPNEFSGPYATAECDCAGGAGPTEGLCDAAYECEDYTSCNCNPVDTTAAASGFWRTDCHCDDYPQDDYGSSNHCASSWIKYRITE